MALRLTALVSIFLSARCLRTSTNMTAPRTAAATTTTTATAMRIESASGGLSPSSPVERADDRTVAANVGSGDGGGGDGDADGGGGNGEADGGGEGEADGGGGEGDADGGGGDGDADGGKGVSAASQTCGRMPPPQSQQWVSQTYPALQ